MNHANNGQRILIIGTFEGKESRAYYDKLAIHVTSKTKIGCDLSIGNGSYVAPDYMAYIAHGKDGLEIVSRLPKAIHWKVINAGNWANGAINTQSQQLFWDQALKDSNGYRPFSGGGKKFRYPIDQYQAYPDIFDQIVKAVLLVKNNPKKFLPLLMHISFNGKLGNPWTPTVWQPKIPDGVHTWEDRKRLEKVLKEQQKEIDAGTYKWDEVTTFTETLEPRICFSDNIQGCFSAIYPNIVKLFDKAPKSEKKMIFQVYYPVEFDLKNMQDFDSLTKNRQVWDAYLTREYCLFTDTKMLKYPMEVHVDLHRDLGDLLARPYNDPQFEDSFHSPIISFEWVEKWEDRNY